jgi:hypothetical protein
MLNQAFLRQALLTLHLIGLALGLGGAGIADFSFFRAVRMGDRITPETVAWMRSVSQVVWVGIGLLTLSGFGLFLMKPHFYLASAGFLAKMVFVGILIINGLFLNFYTTARLTTFNFSQIYTRRDAAWKVRKLSFIFGAVSAVSWYAALLTAQFKGVINISFWIYMLFYVLALGGAISFSLFIEHLLHSRHKNAPLTIDRLTSMPPELRKPIEQPQPVAIQQAPIVTQTSPQPAPLSTQPVVQAPMQVPANTVQVPAQPLL